MDVDPRLLVLLAEIREEFHSALDRIETLPVLLKKKPAAKQLGQSETTLARWIKAGCIIETEVNGKKFISAAEIRRVAAPMQKSGGKLLVMSRPAKKKGYSIEAELAKLAAARKRR